MKREGIVLKKRGVGFVVVCLALLACIVAGGAFPPVQAEGMKQFVHEQQHFIINYDSAWGVDANDHGVKFDMGGRGFVGVEYLGDVPSMENVTQGMKTYCEQPSCSFTSSCAHPVCVLQKNEMVSIGPITGYEYEYTISGMFSEVQHLIFVPRWNANGTEAKVYRLYSLILLSDGYQEYQKAAEESLSSFRFAAKVTFSIAGVNVNASDIFILAIDGVNYPASDLPKSVWLDVGMNHTFSAMPEIPLSTQVGVSYRFTFWDERNFDVHGRHSEATIVAALKPDYEVEQLYTATYVPHYLLSVSSPFGAVRGGGWYSTNDGLVQISVVASTVPMPGLTGLLGARYVFSHWEGSNSFRSNDAVAMVDVSHGPQTVVAYWRADYLVFDVVLAMVVVVGVAALGAVILLVKKRRSEYLKSESFFEKVR